MGATLEVALIFRIQGIEQAKSRVLSQAVYSQEEFESSHGAPASVVERAKAWCTEAGLRLTGQDGFSLFGCGTFEQVGRLLNVGFEETYHLGKRKFRPTAEPVLPTWLEPWLIGVVGLDNIGELRPKYRRSGPTKQLANANQGFFPGDIASAYNVPKGADGSGITIGILEFSNGYAAADLDAFWSAFHIAPPELEFVSVDGTQNDGGTSSVDLECTLDIEWAGAIAPAAKLVLYEANAGGSDRSFGLSVLRSLRFILNDQARHPSVLTISYGDAETRFAPVTMQAWDSTMAEMNARGITVFVASGDQGAYGINGVGLPIRHVDAPANCPHAVAVGGTHLVLNEAGIISDETGWTEFNDNGASGGGLSQCFGVPAWQSQLALPTAGSTALGRGVPDVALNADPDTGYAVFFQGQFTTVGGTSVASPIWAAFTALLNQSRLKKGLPVVGFLAHQLYGLDPAAVYHDITVGNNNYFGVVGYQCGPGWDAVTGLGSVDVSRWIQALS
jgi:kumamolisin